MRALSLRLPVLIILLATSCGGGQPTNPADILIATDLPVAAIPGALPAQLAVELAVNQNPMVGSFRLGYVLFDDSLSGDPFPEKGVQNVQRMIEDPRVLGMVGPRQSSVAAEEIPVANVAHLAMLSPDNTAICLTVPAASCGVAPAALRPAGPNNYFRIAPADPVQGMALARFAVSLGIKRVAILSESPGDGDLIAESFAQELVRTGGEVVLQTTLPSGTVGYGAFLRQARDRGAQAIYAIPGSPDDHICAARAQMKATFPDRTYFLGTDTVAVDPNCASDSAGDVTDIYATYLDVDPTKSTDPASRKVVDAYRTAYPKANDTSIYTYAAYDCAKIMMAAISHAVENNGGRLPSRLQVVDALAHSVFTGVTGTYSFDSYGDATSPLMSLFQIANGHWVYLHKIDASRRST